MLRSYGDPEMRRIIFVPKGIFNNLIISNFLTTMRTVFTAGLHQPFAMRTFVAELFIDSAYNYDHNASKRYVSFYRKIIISIKQFQPDNTPINYKNYKRYHKRPCCDLFHAITAFPIINIA